MNTLKQWVKSLIEKAGGAAAWLVEPLECEVTLGRELRHRQAAVLLARRAYAARQIS